MTCGRSYINLQHYLSLQMANTRWWGSLQIQAPSSGTLSCSHSHFSPARYTNVSHCKHYPPTLFYLHILQNLISASIFTGYCLSDSREVLRTLNLKKNQNKLGTGFCLAPLEDVEIRTDVLNKQGHSVPEGH